MITMAIILNPNLQYILFTGKLVVKGPIIISLFMMDNNYTWFPR